MRAIGIDLGSKTVGISLSDTSRIIASPIGTFEIEENNLNEALELVVDYIKKNNVSTIVLGLPKNMDGSIGFQGEYCLEFKKMLAGVRLPRVRHRRRSVNRRSSNVLRMIESEATGGKRA